VPPAPNQQRYRSVGLGRPYFVGALLCLVQSSLAGQVAPDSEVVQALITGRHLVMDVRRPKEAASYLEFAIENGDADRRGQAATILYTGATVLLEEPQDLVGAADLLRKAIRG
jgi:hypothetical protein